MVSSIIGTLIAAMATASLLLAVESLEKIYKNAGNYNLTRKEKNLLSNAGLNSPENKNILENQTFVNLPSHY